MKIHSVKTNFLSQRSVCKNNNVASQGNPSAIKIYYKISNLIWAALCCNQKCWEKSQKLMFSVMIYQFTQNFF